MMMMKSRSLINGSGRPSALSRQQTLLRKPSVHQRITPKAQESPATQLSQEAAYGLLDEAYNKFKKAPLSQRRARQCELPLTQAGYQHEMYFWDNAHHRES
eukprot:scaffold13749_cov19-Tisochrysis_lutea.AAC.2